MKKILLILALSMPMMAQDYTIAPDGTYVQGNSFAITPKGKYVGGDGHRITPNGNYVGHSEPRRRETIRERHHRIHQERIKNR